MMGKFFRRHRTKLLILMLVPLLLLAVAAVYLDLHLYLLPIPDDLDAAIRQQMAVAKLPGLAIVGLRGDRIVFAEGYGDANQEEGREVTPDTLFQIASVSKLATATALMRLYEQGQFALDDDINLYLPFEVRNPRFPDTPITFRMLLAHVSSIQDGPSYDTTYTLGSGEEDSPLPLGDYLQGYLVPGGKYYDADANYTEQHPGEAYKYTNVGFGLVGYLVEQISGLPFDQYCQQELFEPLGMTTTRWLYRDVDKTKMAMPYRYALDSRRFTPLGYYSFTTYPDGALKTSANEFARFVSLFLNEGKTLDGQQFLRPETVKEMLTLQYPQSSGEACLAWHLDAEDGLYQHSGGDPGVSTMVVISPEKDLGLILFANSGGIESPLSLFGFGALAQNILPRLTDYIMAQ
jgi:CubicO group peptidase (beta-lactamase class C family)